MTGEALIHAVRDGVMQPEAELYLAPVRHHSPACAMAVQKMIREIRPAKVLIEAPHDLEHLIPHLLNPGTVPPVAAASLLDCKDGPRLAAYYPFCAHSPEWIALHEGAEVGAELHFIDLGSDVKIASGNQEETGPQPMVWERAFDRGDYVRALCQRLGCQDGYELWDHLFETRIGDSDWRGFLADVGAYCTALRASTPLEEIESSGDIEREAHMAACLRDAIGAGPVVVVIGGFHSAPLLDPTKTAGKIRAGGKTAAQSYLIRYGYKELDALMGYGAGLPQPAYYEAMWNHAQAAGGAPDWQVIARNLIQGFAEKMRKAGHGISVPAQVELLRSAETLARLRNRPGALRHDLIDALTSALVKGEASGPDVWTERFVTFLRGHALGEVSDTAGQPPIVTDAYTQARALRFDVADGLRRERTLDIRRKPAHLAASRFAHAMVLLGTDFATRTSGPDFLNSVQTGLLFEHWDYAWSPRVEGQLIESAVFGDTVPAACLGHLARARTALAADGRSDDLAELLALFKQGLLAGLGKDLSGFLSEIESALRQSGGFPETAQAICTLHAIEASRGPLSLPEGLEVKGLMQTAFERLIYLCDDLPKMRKETIQPCLDALRFLSELLSGPAADSFETALFDEALDRVAEAGPLPELMGAVTAIAVEGGRKPGSTLSAMLSSQFNGSNPGVTARLGGLRGMLAVAPTLLWTGDGVLAAVDEFLNGLTEEAFLAVLPDLRLALSALSPREADRVANALVRRHGGSAAEFTAHHYDVSAEDARRGAALDTVLRASIRADGLEGWIPLQEGSAE